MSTKKWSVANIFSQKGTIACCTSETRQLPLKRTSIEIKKNTQKNVERTQYLENSEFLDRTANFLTFDANLTFEFLVPGIGITGFLYKRQDKDMPPKSKSNHQKLEFHGGVEQHECHVFLRYSTSVTEAKW